MSRSPTASTGPRPRDIPDTSISVASDALPSGAAAPRRRDPHHGSPSLPAVPAWYRMLAALASPWVRRFASGRAGPWPEAKEETLWIHAASLGECKGLLRVAVNFRPERITATCTTEAGLGKLRRELPGIDCSLLPWDHPRTLEGFLASRRIVAALFLEAEAWPQALASLHALGIPAAFAAVRTHPVASRRWRRFDRLFPGLLGAVDRTWTDGRPTRDFPFPRCRPGSSLKWAGTPRTVSLPSPHRAAAISLHLRDLPSLWHLVQVHRNLGWEWFPRRPWQAFLFAGLARCAGLAPCGDRIPRPGQVRIARRFGLVEPRLPGCAFAWVSPGHDREEPRRRGVPVVLPQEARAAQVTTEESDGPNSSTPRLDPEETLAEVVEWCSSRMRRTIPPAPLGNPPEGMRKDVDF